MHSNRPNDDDLGLKCWDGWPQLFSTSSGRPRRRSRKLGFGAWQFVQASLSQEWQGGCRHKPKRRRMRRFHYNVYLLKVFCSPTCTCPFYYRISTLYLWYGCNNKMTGRRWRIDPEEEEVKRQKKRNDSYLRKFEEIE